MLEKRKLALWITLGVTALVTVLRCVLTPLMQSMDTGTFAFNYVTMGVMLVTFIAVGVLLYIDRDNLPKLPTVTAPWLLPVAVLLMVAGLAILVVSVIELYNWSANGIIPPPGSVLAGPAERVTLFLSLALGILSGVYFMRLGLYFLSENAEVRGAYPLWALAPAFWIWMRLARYEVSYASAVGIHESFFDFAMLLCTMLFLFAFARQMSDVDGNPWKTVWFACATVMMTVSGTLSRVVFFLLGQGDAYRTGQLAGVPDFAVGVLAVAFLLYWVLTPQE
ncbi:MAG: hypothetical protein J6L00_04420, partial [Clostridia bacterium]|nr:hypothetical protein [Clostridia bacterium]